MIAQRDWIYYCLLVLVITLILTGWTEASKLKNKNFIQQSRKEVDDFVAATKLKKDLKYVWDDHTITYYESGEVVETWQWKDLLNFQNGADYFILEFSNKKPTITIPRTMVENKEDLPEFESRIKRTLKRPG